VIIDAVGGEREPPVELALEVGDVLLLVHDGQVLLLLRRADRRVLRLVVPDAVAGDPRGQRVVADAVLY
jgi:hypothetical protein